MKMRVLLIILLWSYIGGFFDDNTNCQTTLLYVNAKAKGAGGGTTDDSNKKKEERKKMTEIRDGVGTILLRLLIIQGIPMTFMCMCCYKLYMKRKQKNEIGKDNNYHRHVHSHDDHEM